MHEWVRGELEETIQLHQFTSLHVIFLLLETGTTSHSPRKQAQAMKALGDCEMEFFFYLLGEHPSAGCEYILLL